MKAHYRTRNGQLTFEVGNENAGVKDLFKQISELQEVFEAETVCGCCKGSNLKFLHRKIDKFDYYEIGCTDCFASFKFGQSQEGGRLFPKRKGEDGKTLSNHGWAKYEKKEPKAA